MEDQDEEEALIVVASPDSNVIRGRRSIWLSLALPLLLPAADAFTLLGLGDLARLRIRMIPPHIAYCWSPSYPSIALGIEGVHSGMKNGEHL